MNETDEPFSPVSLPSIPTRKASFYRDYEIIKKRKQFREDCAKIRAKLAAEVREKERKIAEKEEKLRQEKELQKLRQIEAERIEKERKTKRYFEHNHFHRKIPIEDGYPYYLGDFESQEAGWTPHGKGQFFYKEQPILDGIFNHGSFILGKVIWKHGYIWEGMLRNNLIHGMGVLTKLRPPPPEVESSQSEESSISSIPEKKKLDFNRRYRLMQEQIQLKDDDSDQEDIKNNNGEEEEENAAQYLPREAIAFQGEIVCYRDEFQEGLQIEFQEPVLVNFISPDGFNPRVTLLKHVKEWKYLCRFHQETWPRERVIDFCRYNRFKILTYLPRILDLHTANITPDALRIQDYRNQDYIVKALPKQLLYHEGIEGIDDGKTKLEKPKKFEYRDLVEKVPSRPNEFRRKNIFESREVGIGQAQEEDDEEERERLKKEQWAKVLAERKAKFIQDRQKMYQQEQERLAEGAAAIKRQAEEAEQKESEELTQNAITAELQRVEEEYSANTKASQDKEKSIL